MKLEFFRVLVIKIDEKIWDFDLDIIHLFKYRVFFIVICSTYFVLQTIFFFVIESSFRSIFESTFFLFILTSKIFSIKNRVFSILMSTRLNHFIFDLRKNWHLSNVIIKDKTSNKYFAYCLIISIRKRYCW